MTKQRHGQTVRRILSKYKNTFVVSGVLVFILVVALGSTSLHQPFRSSEVAFTDSSAHGMQIVPASCPSNPFDANAPYGCSGGTPLCADGVSPAPGGNVASCSCAEGNTAACARCPDGSVAPNNTLSQCTCAQGNVSACGNGNGNGGGSGGGGGSCNVGFSLEGAQCVFTGCPVGYSQSAGPSCTFVGCPSGYTQQGNMCVQNACINGPICGGDGNLYLQRSNCSTTFSQRCAYGCSGGACYTPPPSSDITAVPVIVKKGETSKISFSARSVQSCSVAGTNGDGQGWSCAGTACDATTTEQSSPIEAQTTYVLSCTGLDNSQLGASAVVNVVPNFCEPGSPNCN